MSISFVSPMVGELFKIIHTSTMNWTYRTIIIWKIPSLSLHGGAWNICSPPCVTCDAQNTMNSSSQLIHPWESGSGSPSGGMVIAFFSPVLGGRYENLARYFRRNSTLTTPHISIRRKPVQRIDSDSMSISAIIAQLKVRKDVYEFDFVSYRERSIQHDVPLAIIKAESNDEEFSYRVNIQYIRTR